MDKISFKCFWVTKGLVSNNFHWIQWIHRWHLYVKESVCHPRENHVFRSMAEEQNLLSQNMRPHFIFTSLFSPFSDTLLTLIPSLKVPPYTEEGWSITACSGPLCTHPHVCVYWSCSMYWNWCKAPQFLSVIHAPICQSMRISSRWKWRWTGEIPATYID